MTGRQNDPLTRQEIFRRLGENRALLDRFSVRRIGLFGSFAVGEPRPDSDIDLLVEFARPTWENFLGLTDALEQLFGRKVEIMTPDGLEGIRVPSVADSIRNTLAYE